MAIDFKKKLADKRANDAKAKLDAKIQKIANASAPSMHPDKEPRRKKSDKDKAPPPPDILEFNVSDEDEEILRELIEVHQEYTHKASLIKRDKEPITNQIKDILKRYKIAKTQMDGMSINMFGSNRTKISKELLLAHKVSPATIAACTVSGEGKMTLRISPIGQEDEYDD